MEKIVAWLNSEHKYYDGLALLSEFSKNRMLIQNLTRKANPSKLEYELKRIAKNARVVINVKAEKAAAMSIPLAPARNKIIRKGQIIQMEDLPPRLQKLYLANVEKYKYMRALHERAKIMQTDADRAPVVQKLVKLDGQIRENWAAIDSWDGQPDVPGGAIDHRRINANRKFITDNRVKLDKMGTGTERDQLITKMQARIDELMTAEENLNRIKSDLLNQGFKL